jgi:hypothetical protein
MTEAEWLTSDDPQRMLTGLDTLEHDWGSNNHKSSDRKLRLWVEACREACMQQEGIRTEWISLDIAGEIAACTGTWSKSERYTNQVPMADRAALLREIVGNPFRRLALRTECDPCCGSGKINEGFQPPYDCPECGGKGYREPAWLTGFVRGWANGIYEDRTWEQLPILADALEEKGCEEEALLRHLRGEERCSECLGVGYTTSFALTPRICLSCTEHRSDDLSKPHAFGNGWESLRGPHVRGCWALDALLGKD